MTYDIDIIPLTSWLEEKAQGYSYSIVATNQVFMSGTKTHIHVRLWKNGQILTHLGNRVEKHIPDSQEMYDEIREWAQSLFIHFLYDQRLLPRGGAIL